MTDPALGPTTEELRARVLAQLAEAETPMDAEKAYHVLSGAFKSARAVSEGRCPNCGRERVDDDCHACGWHSLSMPRRPLTKEGPSTDE